MTVGNAHGQSIYPLTVHIIRKKSLFCLFKQDYPCLYVHELSYDGKQFTLSNSAEETKTYEYLMKYEDSPKYAFGSVVPQYRYQYVLTHDNRYTYDQLWMSIASSQPGVYIDHYTIYSEPKQ